MRFFKALVLFFTSFGSVSIYAQTPYLDTLYDYRIEQGIYYGTAINYAGQPVDLFLDFYKPIDEGNTKRPLIVIAFGGAFIAGSRNSSDVTSLAPWFAKRGYVVVAPDYRLGFHPSSGGGSNAITCPLVSIESNCVYPPDTNEVIRANYRGMQDLKGLVRFMKARAIEDSICTENIFLAGVSAGGFNALAATFMDLESEKPLAAGELPDAVAPTFLAYCNDYHNSSSLPISRSRPDLGSIEGTIALNGYNARVKGVANFFGGTMQSLFNQADDYKPLLYMHHQTNDVIVSCNYEKVLGPFSNDCLSALQFLGCNPIPNLPKAYGSCALSSILENGDFGIDVLETIIQNGNPNCLANPPGHSIVNPQARVAEIAQFFLETILETESSSCVSPLSTHQKQLNKSLLIYPNPFSETIFIDLPFDMDYVELRNIAGQVVYKSNNQPMGLFAIPSKQFPQGVYTLFTSASHGLGHFVHKVVRMH